jgi:hypothetical protein
MLGDHERSTPRLPDPLAIYSNGRQLQDDISCEGSDCGDTSELLRRSEGSFREWEPTTIEDASMPEMYRSVKMPTGAGWWSKMYTFLGPGLLIAVGYMDPGNWMTDIAAGAAFNYSLLFVVFSSSLMAMFLQGLALRLGMVTRKDIAQHCRDHYSPWVVRFLWVTAEIAIIACDLAEVIGSAVAIKLLFHIPLVWGVIITSLDVLVLLVLSGRSMRWIECIVLGLMSTIIVCFAVELWCALPSAELPAPRSEIRAEQDGLRERRDTSGGEGTATWVMP